MGRRLYEVACVLSVARVSRRGGCGWAGEAGVEVEGMEAGLRIARGATVRVSMHPRIQYDFALKICRENRLAHYETQNTLPILNVIAMTSKRKKQRRGKGE